MQVIKSCLAAATTVSIMCSEVLLIAFKFLICAEVYTDYTTLSIAFLVSSSRLWFDFSLRSSCDKDVFTLPLHE